MRYSKINIGEMMCGSYKGDSQEMYPFSKEYYKHLFVTKKENLAKDFILNK